MAMGQLRDQMRISLLFSFDAFSNYDEVHYFYFPWWPSESINYLCDKCRQIFNVSAFSWTPFP